MSSDDLAKRVRAASRSCADAVSGQVFRSPAEVFADLARSCDELGIEEWDVYGEFGAVQRLESELVELFGVEAAACFPSGVMAQQAALRVHTDRAASRRVALPDLSHLLLHEEDGPRLLHGLEISLLTRGFEAPAARHLAAIPGRVGAVLAELPLREAGCLLPTWDDLAALSEACRERGVALHFDGARIWEAQPWFERPLPEIAALADSLYVSFYKGLGGLAGAALLGPADFIAEARLWRRRLGGTIYHLPPRPSPPSSGCGTGSRSSPTRSPGRARSRPSCRPASPSSRACRTPTTSGRTRRATPTPSTSGSSPLSRSAGSACPPGRRAQEPGRITTEFAVSPGGAQARPRGDGGAGRSGDRSG